MSLMCIFYFYLIFIIDIVVISISSFLPDHNYYIEEDKKTNTMKEEEKDIQPPEFCDSQKQQEQHSNGSSNSEKKNTKENKDNYHHTDTIILQPIPLTALVEISSFLPKNDCINCMSVCTTFYLVFFPRIYNRVRFSTINQIYNFLRIIQRATQLRENLIMTMTTSVDDTTMDNIIISNGTTPDKLIYTNKGSINKTTELFSSLTTDIVFENQVHSWTIANDLRQLFNFCKPNIQALELSWWQLYVFLMTDADYNYNATKQLYNLQYLFVQRISDFEAMGIASTYRYRDVLLTINNVISEGITNLNNENNINDIATHVAITKAMYKVPEMSDLLQFTPNLTNLVLYYEKDKRDSNTTRTTNKLTEYDFEAIHKYCPQLEIMTLEGIELHLAKESAITSAEQYRTFIHRMYPVAAKMRKLSLLKVTFASTQQHHNALLCLYLLFKYSQATTIFIQNPRIDETIYNEQEQREENPISTGYQYYRQIRSFYITHFEHFSFQSPTENAFVFCRQLIKEISNHGESLTRLKMMGFKKRSGGRNKRTKVKPISVDMAWIQKVCPNLQDLILIYATIYNLTANTIIFKTYNDPIYEGVPFVYTYLHRDSISSSWSIQEFTPETKIIETT